MAVLTSTTTETKGAGEFDFSEKGEFDISIEDKFFGFDPNELLFKPSQDIQPQKQKPKEEELLRKENEILKSRVAYLEKQILVKPKVGNDESKLTLHGLSQYYVELKEKAKTQKLFDLLDALEFNEVCIFVNTQQKARQLNKLLNDFNFPAICIYGSLSQKERLKRFKLFKTFQKRIMVSTCSTDLIGKGIDIVVNYDMPEDSDTYLHRVGRAGRFGTKGLCISFVSNDQNPDYFKNFEKITDKEVLGECQKRFMKEGKILVLPNKIDANTYMNNTGKTPSKYDLPVTSPEKVKEFTMNFEFSDKKKEKNTTTVGEKEFSSLRIDDPAFAFLTDGKNDDEEEGFKVDEDFLRKDFKPTSMTSGKKARRLFIARSANCSIFEKQTEGKTEWVERGKGDITINVSKSNPKEARMVMRRSDWVGTLCLNAVLYESFPINLLGEKGISFNAIDCSRGHYGQVPNNGRELRGYLLYFRDKETCKQFVDKVKSVTGKY